MIRSFLLSVAALSLIACSGGSETSQSAAQMSVPEIADRMIADGAELSELLTRVTSAESAEAIQPRLQEMMEGYREVVAQFEQMDEPGFADMAALASRGPQIATVQRDIAEEINRITQNHPEAYQVLADNLNRLGTP